MTTAAIYARFSSQLQKDSSIEDQVRICTERAKREGWQVTEVFSDYAISGAVRDRPGLNALIEHVAQGRAQIVLSEAIDRLSRDQEDLSSIHKQVRFHGGRIITLSEGDVDELQIGFKGTMASLFRKDMAAKIRRGQTGRVEAGRMPAGILYGYRKVQKFDAKGEPERGLREIYPEQAEIVRRIYREYLMGESPRAIAARLNAEGVPSARGKKWSTSSILGNAARGNGVLCNPIYAGEIVFGRTRKAMDPLTRKYLIRTIPEAQWQRVPVPELAIVSKEDWDAVAEMRAKMGWKGGKPRTRPKRLLSGLMECGVCSGSMIIIGAGKVGCSNYRNRGACSNSRTMKARLVERRVMKGLTDELLKAETVATAVKAYHDERESRERSDRRRRLRERRQLSGVEKKIDRLVEAIKMGAGDIDEVVEQLHKLRDEREQLIQADQAINAEKVITLHPNVAKAYRRAIEGIVALAAADSVANTEARNAMRSVINRVILSPAKDARGLTIEIEGQAQAILDIAGGKTRGFGGTLAMERVRGIEPL